MVNHFHAVRGPVEERAVAELRQDRIFTVVDHVVRHNGRHRVSLERVDAAFQQHQVVVGEQVVWVRHVAASSGFQDTVAHVARDLLDRVLELLHDGLSLERFDAESTGRGRRDDKGDDSDGRTHVAQSSIQA